MKGLEISKKFYLEYGEPMLKEQFSDLLPFLAVGFVGGGSERFGFDDEISRDHDFEAGFCIFIPDEEVIDSRKAFQLERAYAKLPKEYMGVKRQQLSPVGGDRNGVIRTSDFYQRAIGSKTGELSLEQWLRIPDYALAEAVNGQVFFDNYGEFSAIREKLTCMPNDIKLKRLAGNLLIMAQSGQYNFMRCIKHGEPEAAQLACIEFINATMKTSFILQNKYMPYYKWSFRALGELFGGKELSEKLSFLMFGDNHDEKVAENKSFVIEEIASEIITKLQDKELTKAVCGDLEKHAYSVNDKISDSTVRNMDILIAVGE